MERSSESDNAVGLRTRILISGAIGLATGFLCWAVLHRFDQGAADFRWAIRMARDLLARRNPYDTYMQLYPLPAALFGLPFVWMTPVIAGGCFYGISSALMAFALMRDGYHRLLVFFAYPYWAAMLACQWSPLLVAAALLPWALPAVLAKPQLGLPVAATHLSWRGAGACAIVLLLSFAVLPHWPWLWVQHFGEYDHFFPLLVLPGPILALSLLRFRDRSAILLLLMSITPQRWFYDSLILWLVPKSRREIVWTVFFSWWLGLWRWYHMPHSFTQVGRWTVLCVYLPMLAVVLLRTRRPACNHECEA